jgi:hypothetical protein
MPTAERSVTADRRPFHHDEASALEMLNTAPLCARLRP